MSATTTTTTTTQPVCPSYLCRSASCRRGQLCASCLMVESVMALVSFTAAKEAQ
jgi:hypothetical protein